MLIYSNIDKFKNNPDEENSSGLFFYKITFKPYSKHFPAAFANCTHTLSKKAGKNVHIPIINRINPPTGAISPKSAFPIINREIM